jgi:glutaredoxin
VKEFLRQKGVAFRERDVAAEPPALEEIRRMGFRSTPVTVIEGTAVPGWDRARLERLLAP